MDHEFESELMSEFMDALESASNPPSVHPADDDHGAVPELLPDCNEVQ